LGLPTAMLGIVAMMFGMRFIGAVTLVALNVRAM
jgi:hypothetical protein